MSPCCFPESDQGFFYFVTMGIIRKLNLAGGLFLMLVGMMIYFLKDANKSNQLSLSFVAAGLGVVLLCVFLPPLRKLS